MPQPEHFLNMNFLIFRAFINRLISYPCELSKAIFLGFSMFSEKHVTFDFAHTRFMLLYVDTYSE